MDARAIGVFDSGLGGLTAVRELTAHLPQEDIIYFGDTGRVPYGSRSRQTIIRYAKQDVAFLKSFDLKAIAIACGTVSSTALEELRAANTIPVLGVVGPAAARAVEVTKNGKVGLIGTKATIRAGALEAGIRALRPEVQVYSNPCPLFVPLVEDGRFRRGEKVVELLVEEYLAPLKAQGVDTLVLGCTHYPLLEGVIGDYMGPGVTLVDTGAECARALGEKLRKDGHLNEPSHQGRCRYYVSDSTEGFAQSASLFLQRNVVGEVERVEIERY